MICTNDLRVCENEATIKVSFKVRARRGMCTDHHVFYLCSTCAATKEILYTGYYDYCEEELKSDETP